VFNLILKYRKPGDLRMSPRWHSGKGGRILISITLSCRCDRYWLQPRTRNTAQSLLHRSGPPVSTPYDGAQQAEARNQHCIGSWFWNGCSRGREAGARSEAGVDAYSQTGVDAQSQVVMIVVVNETAYIGKNNPVIEVLDLSGIPMREQRLEGFDLTPRH
jgi:hypothetical protein